MDGVPNLGAAHLTACRDVLRDLCPPVERELAGARRADTWGLKESELSLQDEGCKRLGFLSFS